VKRTIYLIVEDETDAEVVNAILKAKGISLNIYRLGSGGIFSLAKQLKDLIEIAKKKRKKGDCIAVLHDADIHKQPKRQAYEQIKAICKEYSSDVRLIIAHDEIEAWLFADEGFCKWLGIKAENADRLKHPSARLNSIIKDKKGKKYSLIRSQALTHLDGTGDKYSPSMQKAVAALIEADCLQP
jgi:hypothetical protein